MSARGKRRATEEAAASAGPLVGGRAPYTALQWALRKSGVATSWPEKERFGAVMELVEEAIFVPLAGEERIGGGFVVG